MTVCNPPHDALRYHVTGAIERGESSAVVEIPPATHTVYRFDHAPSLELKLVNLNPDSYYSDPRPFLAQNKVITNLRKKVPPAVTGFNYSPAPWRSDTTGWDPMFAYNGRRKGDKALLESLLNPGTVPPILKESVI